MVKTTPVVGGQLAETVGKRQKRRKGEMGPGEKDPHDIGLMGRFSPQDKKKQQVESIRRWRGKNKPLRSRGPENS